MKYIFEVEIEMARFDDRLYENIYELTLNQLKEEYGQEDVQDAEDKEGGY